MGLHLDEVHTVLPSVVLGGENIVSMKRPAGAAAQAGVACMLCMLKALILVPSNNNNKNNL